MKHRSALAVVLIAMTGPAFATEYLSNGSFETSLFSPWELDDIPGTDSVVATDNDFLASTMALRVAVGLSSAPLQPLPLALSLSDVL